MRDPLVPVVRQWLAEAGFDPGICCVDFEYFDAGLEGKVRAYQDARGLQIDGIVGVVETWPALERDHLVHVATTKAKEWAGKILRKLGLAPDAAIQPTLPERPLWAEGLQDAINKLCSGKVGYGTPQDKRPAMLKRPLEDRIRAELFDTLEAPLAAKHGTTHTFGGCSSLASRVLAGCVLKDPTHRAFANQTCPTPPIAIRDPRFKSVRDNLPDAMIDGDHTWQASGWAPTCRGYASLFDHVGMTPWSDLDKVMIGVPFALLHLQGGHVITAFYSDHERGWYYYHPITGQLLPDDTVYILAADGWSGNVGQPTTLQRSKDRLSKKNVENLWLLVRPTGFSDSNPRLTVTFG